MSYIGKWVFHSIMTWDDDGNSVYLSAEDYINSPMPYVDESDPEAVEDEMKERKEITGLSIKIDEDGKLYMLTPLPEGIPQAEIDAAVSAGEVTIIDGMMSQQALAWEERDGELWYDTAIEGEVFGEAAETWARAIDENGFFTFMNFRFTKAE